MTNRNEILRDINVQSVGALIHFHNAFKEKHEDKTAVFLSINGSRLYGTNRPDSDYDFVGACIEPLSYFFAFKNFEQAEISLPEVPCEGNIYSLNKFVGLLAKCNPTLLATIYNTEGVDFIGVTTEEFQRAVVSVKAADAFHGYATQQIHRVHTTKGLHVTRQNLIDQYGYDTKYAAHVFRLVAQGIELLATGKISLPMQQSDIDDCLFVLNGGFKTLDDFVKEAKVRLSRLSEAEKHTSLPEKSDIEYLNDFLVTTYRKYYSQLECNP